MCPDCGIQLGAIDQGESFLTDSYQTRREGVSLATGAMLIDRFQIKNLLGKGRFGTIYLADDTLRLKEVALKVVDLGFCEENLAALHLQHEMKIRDKILDYSYVIQVFDFHLVPWEGSVLLLQSMEYANGGTFRKWLVEHKENFETRRKTGLKLFIQACYGVRSFHQAKAVHLDLKPENLLFCDNLLKVSDFGTARLDETIRHPTGLLRDTASPEAGTPIYMSPEQFITPHPNDLDARSDIYSLGIILYELIHPKCCPPFGGSFRRLRELHLGVPAPRLPEAGEKLSRIVTRCLEKNPAYRFQSVDELIDALEGKLLHEVKAKNAVDIESKNIAALLEKTWEKASHCYTKGNFKEAAALADDVLTLQSDHTPARRLKEELNDRFGQAERFYQEISVNLQGDLSDSIKLLEEAISIYPDHPSGHLVQTKLAARVRQYREAMQEGLNALQEEHWETALAWYRKAFQLLPGTQHLSQIIEFLNQIENTRREIDTAIQQGKFHTALGLARSLDISVEEMKERLPALRESRMYDDT
jgi:serine/threonine protein kinase